MKDQPGSTKTQTMKILCFVFFGFFLLHSTANLKLYFRSIQDLNSPEKSCGVVKIYRFGGGKSTGWNLHIRNAEYEKYTFNLSKDYIQSRIDKNVLKRNRKICVEYIYLKYSIFEKFIMQIYLDDVAFLDHEEVVRKYLYDKRFWPTWLIFIEFLMAMIFLIASNIIINGRRK